MKLKVECYRWVYVSRERELGAGSVQFGVLAVVRSVFIWAAANGWEDVVYMCWSVEQLVSV